MSKRTFAHQVRHRIVLASGADSRAPGGAVTVALCGHWDHEGPCRWPHHTAIEASDGASHEVTVRFDAPEQEREQVSALIDGALQKGEQEGSDGQISSWALSPTQP